MIGQTVLDGETLMTFCTLKMMEIVLEKLCEHWRKTLALISLSNSAVQIKVSDVITGIKDEVVREIKSAASGLVQADVSLHFLLSPLGLNIIYFKLTKKKALLASSICTSFQL